MSARRLLAIGLLLLLSVRADAHGLSIALLEVREVGGGRVLVSLHAATGAGREPGIHVELPGCREESEPQRREVEEGVLISWTASCGGLDELSVRWDDPASAADVLARVERRDGTRVQALLTPAQPRLSLAAGGARLRSYLTLGVRHVLTGWDHLLFLVGLLLLARTARRTVLTATAFTLGHSITLSLATLGVVRVPTPPVEACIALSVLALAVELTRRQPGLATRAPWLVAGSFGLLHGFGFAGALAGIGLPAGDIPWALAGFNLGVEVGQLAVIAAALVAVRALPAALRTPGQRAALYLMGSMACFWLLERLASFPGVTP